MFRKNIETTKWKFIPIPCKWLGVCDDYVKHFWKETRKRNLQSVCTASPHAYNFPSLDRNSTIVIPCTFPSWFLPTASIFGMNDPLDRRFVDCDIPAFFPVWYGNCCNICNIMQILQPPSCQIWVFNKKLAFWLTSFPLKTKPSYQAPQIIPTAVNDIIFFQNSL